MPRTYETTTPTNSNTIREEQSGVVLQFRNTPDALKRLAERRNENTHFERERDHLRSEMGFQKHRHFASAQAMDRILALERQAIEEFPIKHILAATDSEENQALYEEVCRIENSYINQLITLDHEAGATFEQQRGLSRLNLIKFFLSKTELCYHKGIKLNEKNLDAHILTDTNLRLNDIRKQIRQLFNEAREIGQNEPETFQIFKADVAALTTENMGPEVPLPTKAPELYKDRPDRKMKPDAFIRNVYKHWLGKGLLRPHIKDLDESLYRALYKHGVPNDFETLLPTAKGHGGGNKNGRKPVFSDLELAERVRAKGRERSKRHYERKKQAAKIMTS